MIRTRLYNNEADQRIEIVGLNEVVKLIWNDKQIGKGEEKL